MHSTANIKNIEIEIKLKQQQQKIKSLMTVGGVEKTILITKHWSSFIICNSSATGSQRLTQGNFS
jgi:hypothetical protein